MPKPTLVVEIDWDADGDFGDTGEDVTNHLRYLRTFQGRRGPLGMAAPAICELELQNREARYSPENSSSPLSPNVLPRRRLRVRTTAPVARTIFDGRIDDIRIEQLHNSSKAYIVALDESAFLLRERGWIFTRLTADVPLLEPDGNGVGPKTGVAVTAALDEVDWPGGSRDIDTGVTEMNVWWARDPLDAFDAISALVTEELGFAFVDAGVFTFQARDYRYTGARLASVATYSDAAGAARRYSRMEPYRMGVESVFNKARATARPRKTAGTLQLGEMGSTPALAPGESRVFIITWNNPAAAVSDTTMVANSKADGSGTDLTSQITKVNGTAKATRWPITLTNDTDPPRVAYITQLVGGLAVREQDGEGTELEVEDTPSQDAYGIRYFPVEPQFIGKVLNAQDWAGYAVASFKNPMPVLTLRFKPYNATILSEMLTRKLSNRVTVVSNEIGINDDYFIEGMGYEWHPDRETWLTTMVVSKVEVGNQFFLFDHATLGRFANAASDTGYGAFFG